VGERGASPRQTPASAEDLEAFRAAGRTLFSLGLIKGAEGNLSTFSGDRLLITRTGARLDRLSPSDLLPGTLDAVVPGASSDFEIHRTMYADLGPGALVHSHPAGTTSEVSPSPGGHGLYVFASTLTQAVERTAERVRGLETT
jgi:hypothetical protein